MHDQAACEDFCDPRQPRLPLCTCGVKSPDPVWHAAHCPVHADGWREGFAMSRTVVRERPSARPLPPPTQSSALDSHSYVGPLGVRMVDFGSKTDPQRFEFSFAIPYDMAEWFFLHTVTGTSKWIDDQTAIVSTIFHASNHECYVADAFEPKDHRDSITCDFTSSAEALWRLTPFCEARVRLIREMRGLETFRHE